MDDKERGLHYTIINTAKQSGDSGGLQRKYPSWLNTFGYTGSLFPQQDATLSGASAEDPFMKQLRDAQAASAESESDPPRSATA